MDNEQGAHAGVIYIPHSGYAIYRSAWAIVYYNGWAVQSLKSVIAIVPTLSFLYKSCLWGTMGKTYIVGVQ